MKWNSQIKQALVSIEELYKQVTDEIIYKFIGPMPVTDQETLQSYKKLGLWPKD